MALNAKATQEFVPIKEIRDGTVVLKNGGLRAVIMVSSINMSLKSEDEQGAVLYQFQNFLNTLDFSIQISLQSRHYDITGYIASLEEQMRNQTEELLKVQTQEYIQFIRTFNETNNVMTKHFFVVVPFDPVTTPSVGVIDKIMPNPKKKEDKDEDFEKAKSQLEERVDVVKNGLSRMGLRSVNLKVEQEIELFYKSFNPGDAETRLEEIGN